jgi:hypothetical protein
MNRVFLVVYSEGEDGGIYAAAFSSRAHAESFAREMDGEIIDTTIDAHLDAPPAS